MVKIAVGYVRCSTDEQGSTSIPQQKEEIKKWADVNQFTITKWFVDEGKSGTTFNKRPAFQELATEIENKPNFYFVLVYDESRWGRALNPRENSYWKIHFERHGVKVRIINSSSQNGDDIGSYVVEVVESAEASEYSKKLSRSIRRGMLSDQQGKYSRGGTAPYGYKRVAIDLQTGERKDLRDGLRSVPKQEKVVWELGDPREVEVVTRIFKMNAEGIGYVSIADTLNVENISCPKRGRWRSRDQKWSGSTIGTIIHNPVYKGDRVYNRLSFSRFVARERGVESGGRVKLNNDQKNWIIVPNAHPVIVSPELYKKANESNGHKPSVKPNQHYYRSTFLLTGLIKCTHCGYNYQGHHHKQTGNRYYVDGGFINKGKSVCSWHSVRQDELEKFILDGIKKSLFNPTIREKVEEQLERLMVADPLGMRNGTERIDTKIKDTEAKIQALIRLVETGMSVEQIGTRLKELDMQLQALKAERDRYPIAPIQKMDRDEIRSKVLGFLNDFERKFDHVEIIERKEFLRRTVDRILIDRATCSITCYLKVLPGIENPDGFGEKKNNLLGAASSANGNILQPVCEFNVFEGVLN